MKNDEERQDGGVCKSFELVSWTTILSMASPGKANSHDGSCNGMVLYIQSIPFEIVDSLGNSNLRGTSCTTGGFSISVLEWRRVYIDTYIDVLGSYIIYISLFPGSGSILSDGQATARVRTSTSWSLLETWWKPLTISLERGKETVSCGAKETEHAWSWLAWGTWWILNDLNLIWYYSMHPR